MNQKTFLFLAISALLVLVSASLPLINAETVRSLPTEVPFYIQGNNTYENQTLIVNILSPQSKIYSCTTSSLKIALSISTNLNASCYYSLDNSSWISLGKSYNFIKTLTIPRGKHNLVVWCRAGVQETIKSVNFSVKEIKETASAKQLALDETYESQLKQTKYGEWSCISNRLQRTITVNNLQQVEYGQICGLELSASNLKQKNNSNLWLIMPIIFLILVLIAIVLVALALSRE